MGAFLYFGITEGSGLNGSLGRYLMEIVTVDENGQPLDYGKSFTRAICMFMVSL